MNKNCLLKKTIASICAAVITVSGSLVLVQSFTPVHAVEDKKNEVTTLMRYKDYYDILQEYEKQGYEAVSGFERKFGMDSYIPESGKSTQKKVVDGKEGILLNADNGLGNFKISVERSGLYTIGCDYIADEGTGLTPIRKITLDGKSPFSEAANIPFYRMWKDSEAPKENSIGDEVKPQVKEIVKWSTVFFHDSLGKYPSPLLFYLEAGEHILTLEYVDQPLVVSAVKVASPSVTDDYSTYISKYKEMETTGFSARYEAEEALSYRNDTSTGLVSDTDPKASPSSVGYIKLNTFGGYSYRKGGQSVTFTVSVPKAGLYSINFRSKQVWAGKLPSYREILINGELPFSALQSYPFSYSRKWQNCIPEKDKTPYLFYFKNGENEITLNTNSGPNTEILKLLNNSLTDISVLIRKIVMITGTEPDPNYDYDLDVAIPSLIEELSKTAKVLESSRSMTDAQNGGKETVMGNNILSVTTQLKEMIKTPEKIPRRLSDLNSIVTSIGDWILTLQEQALQIDYIELFSPDVQIRNYNSSFIDNIWATLTSFYISFFKDYNYIASSSEGSSEAKDVISVWIGRGKEWAEILKELADSEFTPKTGIEINLNVLPSGQIATMGAVNPLMLAIGAGKAPDVAMGVASTMPVEYAIRNAVTDLSQFDGFKDIVKRFPEQLMVPFQYRGGIYGIPETMYFRGLFYRKDILEDLKIKVPETWDEVFNDVLPKLYENGAQMYIPGWFDMFLYSNNGAFYNEEGTKSALDTPEAYKAFDMMCKIYTVYGVPASANFLNRFRTGEMPIGVEGSPMYMQLIAAAPELAGRWGMAPIPGVLQEDGTVNRNTAGYVGESVVILSDSQKKDAAFQFINWWTSTKTQTAYGREIEGRIGSYARWLTSNTEAFKQLPWNREDLNVITGSWSTLRETPNVLGGYFTSRHISNAWNRTVVGGMSARDSLEMCILDINTELMRRQEQLLKK